MTASTGIYSFGICGSGESGAAGRRRCLMSCLSIRHHHRAETSFATPDVQVHRQQDGGVETGDRDGHPDAAAHGWPCPGDRERETEGGPTEVRAVLQELLDREVNRSIARHGGKISILDVRDGNLFIAMSGGCQGCAASQVTLRQGFEVMVRRVAPEIVDIVDTTDHAAGKKPFYQRTG
jgi:Fe-S cluster biogenesis protein NfuA